MTCNFWLQSFIANNILTGKRIFTNYEANHNKDESPKIVACAEVYTLESRTSIYDSVTLESVLISEKWSELVQVLIQMNLNAFREGARYITISPLTVGKLSSFL